MDFDTSFTAALDVARTTVETLDAQGEVFQPMLHIDTAIDSKIAVLGEAPRHMTDPWRTGRQIAAEVGGGVTAVFFISDSYQLHTPTVGDEQTTRLLRRYNAGISLEQMYKEGVPEVVEALAVVGMSRVGAVRQAQQYYDRRGGTLVWTDVTDSTSKGTGAVYDLLAGILGLET